MPEAQAKALWRAPGGPLGALSAAAATRAAGLRHREAELLESASSAPIPPSLRSALLQPVVAVIAEVKRSSPSKGMINPTIDAAAQARAYERGGAAAVSVLTEPDRFGGSEGDLAAVTHAVRLPAIKKDFHVAPVQLAEARALGASAALLIARALAPGQLEELLAAAGELALEAVVEVRDEAELERALAAGAAIVGVNNRNLETLEIDATTAVRLIPRIPLGVAAVAESGMSSVEDIARAARAGADAVLVGSALSAAADPAAAVSVLAGVSVCRDARRS